MQSAASRLYAKMVASTMNSTKTVEPGRGHVPQERWRQWGDALRRHQLQGIVGWLLEASGPLALVAAQLLYIGRPLLGTRAHELAQLLESDEQLLEFAGYLQSGTSSIQRSSQGNT